MKFIHYVLCFLAVLSGVVCGIGLFKEITAHSKSYGDGTDVNFLYSMESFKYENTSVTFITLENETTKFEFSKQLLPVEDFDGETNKYEITVNGYVCKDTVYDAGEIESNFCVDFYNTQGENVCSSKIVIKITFLSNKTLLKISCDGVDETTYMHQYFKNNGIRLKVNKI